RDGRHRPGGRRGNGAALDQFRRPMDFRRMRLQLPPAVRAPLQTAPGGRLRRGGGRLMAEFSVGITDDNVHDMMSHVPELMERLAAEPGVRSGPVDGKTPVTAERLADVDVLIAGGVEFVKGSLAEASRCAAIVRFGSGYDKVDIEACNRAGI